ncbi:putative sterigmatocystin biosynthesis peroxidase stcC [Colletotrichum tanaceti]|uniref:Putative sterigmatocystin biosynthesis peroxidase stcC n=1 Tax=Colletotrichum tanaceti TaxID=1306861 RepID=A0A4U6X8T5_9PEZI|nr:putative sterigmatocystin biosynthesis peroxidase stcC [Colletotrichum tanaceti]TKW51493.1 putative sterigmatocystin biosynthesis peroxidase stcC [Colletotrichum tanaceti]
MRACTALAATVAVFAHAGATFDFAAHPWVAPGATDLRGPCPMLNTLANHGILAHDGRSISMDDLISGLGETLHFNDSLVRTLGTPAFSTSTTGDPTTFHLDDIAKPEVIEHMGSLSRADAFTGDAKSFNAAVWAETRGYLEEGAAASGKGTVDIKTMATARSKRIATARATNPAFSLTARQVTISLGESAVILGTFGQSYTAPAAPLEWLAVVFEKERMPEGWTKSETQITVEQVMSLSALINAASPSS